MTANRVADTRVPLTGGLEGDCVCGGKLDSGEGDDCGGKLDTGGVDNAGAGETFPEEGALGSVVDVVVLLGDGVAPDVRALGGAVAEGLFGVGTAAEGLGVDKPDGGSVAGADPGLGDDVTEVGTTGLVEAGVTGFGAFVEGLGPDVVGPFGVVVTGTSEDTGTGVVTGTGCKLGRRSGDRLGLIPLEDLVALLFALTDLEWPLLDLLDFLLPFKLFDDTRSCVGAIVLDGVAVTGGVVGTRGRAVGGTLAGTGAIVELTTCGALGAEAVGKKNLLLLLLDPFLLLLDLNFFAYLLLPLNENDVGDAVLGLGSVVGFDVVGCSVDGRGVGPDGALDAVGAKDWDFEALLLAPFLLFQEDELDELLSGSNT